MYIKERHKWNSGVIRRSKTSPGHLQIEFDTASPFHLMHSVSDFSCYIDLPVLDCAETRKGETCFAGFVEFPTHYVVLYSASVESCRRIVSGESPLNPTKPVLYPRFLELELVALAVSSPQLMWWGTLYRFNDACSMSSPTTG